MRFRPASAKGVSRWLLVLSVLVTASGVLEAFDSYPVGAPHDQITEAAAKNAGFSKKTIEALKKAVRAPDWDESSRKHWLTFAPNANYRANHHFDRGPGKTDKQAFTDGAAYVREQKQEAIDKAKMGEKEASIAALGRALHALQDFKAHSNYVDLTAEEQKQAHDAIFDASKMPPDNLKLTGYDPKAKNPEKPPGDAYPHEDFAKDNPKKNDESKKKIGDKTKYELAKEAAIKESEDLLNMVKDALSAEQWEGLLAAVISPDPNDAKYTWGQIEPCGFAGCVLVGDDGSLLDIPPGALATTQEVGFLAVPDTFFYTDDQLFAPDGFWMMAYWEVRVENEVLEIPAFAEVHLSPEVAVDLDPTTAQVYVWNPVSGDWEQVPDGVVEVPEGLASFPVSAPGVYAVGGLSLTMPVPVETPPVVAITAPADGSMFSFGEVVTFTGTAIDEQDGDLSDTLVWSSSLDGTLGVGAVLTTLGLSEGIHAITAAATDSEGLTSEDQITLEITAIDLPAGSSCAGDSDCASQRCLGRVGSRTCG